MKHCSHQLYIIFLTSRIERRSEVKRHLSL
nr:MAG TPA: hypothetical protein [Caudoviricetes sp.]